MSRDWDSEKEQEEMDGKNVENGYTPKLMYERLSKRLGSLFTFFSEPAFENLLPPPPPEQYRRPLTLVVTLDDFLIHSTGIPNMDGELVKDQVWIISWVICLNIMKLSFFFKPANLLR